MRTKRPDARTKKLVLASASPARRTLLQAAGIEPEVLISGVDESTVGKDSPEGVCLGLARLKAQAVAGRIRSDQLAAGGVLVLGCDSVLEFDGQILGKPRDTGDAVERWRAMRGRSGVLHSGHCLIDLVGTDADDDREVARVASTTVHFADITDGEIAAYVASGEPLRVAGAFTIDGLGGAFVERIDGDPGTVVGLSLPLLRSMLAEVGVKITDLWAQPRRPAGDNVQP